MKLIKSKSYIIAIMAAIVLVCALMVGVSLGTDENVAYAAGVTTPSYTVHFSYSAYYKSNATETITGSSPDTTSCTCRIGQYNTASYSVTMFGSGASGTADMPIGGYINSSTVTVRLNTTSSVALSVGGNGISKSGSSVTLTDAPDGTYYGYFGGSGSWLVSNRQYDQAGFSASFSFNIDTVAPTITGASTSTNNYTNSAFTVSASDSASGVENLYMMSPSSSSYTAVGTSRTVSADSANGLYKFYAKDKAGNNSATYYVYLDTSKPTGKLSTTAQYTASAFTYSATDTGSGINYMQYTTPSNGTWTTYSGTTIASNSGDGKYQFRAVDKCGNISATSTIFLDTTKPTGTLYAGSTAKSSGAIINAEYIKFVTGDTLSGVKAAYVKTPGASSYISYTSGSQYVTNGTYSFYCVDNANNTSDTYTITLDTIKPVGSITNESGTALTGTYTKVKFKFTGSDGESGVQAYEYKTPTSTTWQSYTSGTYIATTATNGTYTFRLYDKASNYSDEYSITLDSTKPTCQLYAGTSTVASGAKTKISPIKFITSDSGSGLKGAYVKIPGATAYTAYTSGITYTNNGTYSFYSEDNIGNKSATYTITLDTVAPTGSLSVTGEYTNKAFSYTATDNLTGIGKLQYMGPTDSTWQTYTSGTVVPTTATNGKYMFRALDLVENVSAVSSITLDTVKPTGKIMCGTTEIANGGKTNQEYMYVGEDALSGIKTLYCKVPDGTSFGNLAVGTTLNLNGVTQFYCEDYAGNCSDIISVTFDSGLPTGVLKTTSSAVITSQYTNQAFNYSATDSGTGVAKMEYKTPGSSTWQMYTGATIATTATNGEYRFRAIDECNNISAESVVSLDSTKPTGTVYGGTKTVASGSATNAGYVKFVGSDNLSGIKTLYVKTPDSTSYKTYTSGSQLTDNGTYYFYCTDKANNTSATYSVTLDNVAPELVCAESLFYEEYDDDFTVTTSDAISNVTLYYKTPSMSDFVMAEGNSVTVADTQPNGKYYFYAKDTTGNTSATYWIQLNVVYPVATIIKDDAKNTIKINWSDNSTGQLNGALYVKNTLITKEGNYSFILTSEKNRSTTYNFTLNHSYYVADTIAPTCLDKGYSVYKCVSCSSTYNADYVNALGHDYRESTVAATCTSKGGIHHICSRCDDEYVTDEVQPYGHSYIESTVEATCEENGCLRHSCVICDYYYDTDIVPATGHDFETEVKTKATCTTDGCRSYVCRKCGFNKETVIPSFGHNYEITDAENTDGVTIRTYTCTVCGDTYEQDLGNQYEEVSNYVEYLFDQYSPYMWYVLLATVGVWSIAMGVAIIVAKKHEEQDKARKMVKNYIIGLVLIAVILVGCPYLVKGIAILVT